MPKNIKENVSKIAKSMMGNTLITKQTGENGKKVNRVFIEEGCEIDKEFYLSFVYSFSLFYLFLDTLKSSS